MIHPTRGTNLTKVSILAGSGILLASYVLAYGSAKETPETDWEHDVARTSAREVAAARAELGRAILARLREGTEAGPQGDNRFAVDERDGRDSLHVDEHGATPPVPPGPTETERIAYADAVFEAQGYDREWASEATERLEHGLSQVQGASLTVEELECRSELCRIRFEPAEEARARTFVADFLRGDTWRGAGMVTRDESAREGEAIVALFLARPGTELPEEPYNQQME